MKNNSDSVFFRETERQLLQNEKIIYTQKIANGNIYENVAVIISCFFSNEFSREILDLLRGVLFLMVFLLVFSCQLAEELELILVLGVVGIVLIKALITLFPFSCWRAITNQRILLCCKHGKTTVVYSVPLTHILAQAFGEQANGSGNILIDVVEPGQPDYEINHSIGKMLSPVNLSFFNVPNTEQILQQIAKNRQTPAPSPKILFSFSKCDGILCSHWFGKHLFESGESTTIYAAGKEMHSKSSEIQWLTLALSWCIIAIIGIYAFMNPPVNVTWYHWLAYAFCCIGVHIFFGFALAGFFLPHNAYIITDRHVNYSRSVNYCYIGCKIIYKDDSAKLFFLLSSTRSAEFATLDQYKDEEYILNSFFLRHMEETSLRQKSSANDVEVNS